MLELNFNQSGVVVMISRSGFIWPMVFWCGAFLCVAMAGHAEGEDSRRAVTDKAAQEAAKKLVADIFRDEYKSAKTPPQKAALAGKMLDMAAETKDDPDSRYMLLRIARDVAVQAADAEKSLSAVDSLAAEYRVDGLQMKFDVLAKFARSRQALDQSDVVLAGLGSLYEKAVAAGKYGIAERAAGLEVSMAKMVQDNTMRVRALKHQKAAAKLQAMHGNVEQAIMALKENPEDPKANLAVGKFHCFARGEWNKGLPALALCSDPALKAVAKQELVADKNTAEKVRVGDAWWNLAQKREDDEQTIMKHRAAHWYAQAGSDQTTVAKLKIRKRLEEVAKLPPAPWMKTAGKSEAEKNQLIEKRMRAFVEALPNAKPVNCGPGINTVVHECCASISGDGCELVFESGRPGSFGRADVWMATRTSTKKPFGMPFNLGRHVNSSNAQGCPEISDDGRLLIYQSQNPNGYGNLDLWACSRTGRGKPFGMPVNLGDKINTASAEQNATISDDWLTLMFDSTGPMVSTVRGIYVATRTSKREPFGKPVRLGLPINDTEEGARSPCLAFGGRLLLFDSKRSGGQGDRDLWVAVRSGPGKPWQEPINMGPRINTGEAEFSPAILADG